MSGHLLIFLGTRLVCKVWSTIYLPLDPATFPLYTLGACKFHVSGKQNTPEFDCTNKNICSIKKENFLPRFQLKSISPHCQKKQKQKKQTKKNQKKNQPRFNKTLHFW